MYLDLIVLAVLIVFVIIYAKRFQTYMIGLGMIDVIFRILNVVKGYIPAKDIKNLINTYIPSSVPDVINKYTGSIDVLNTALIFIYVIIMLIFLYYLICVFIKRKKI